MINKCWIYALNQTNKCILCLLLCILNFDSIKQIKAKYFCISVGNIWLSLIFYVPLATPYVTEKLNNEKTALGWRSLSAIKFADRVVQLFMNICDI